MLLKRNFHIVCLGLLLQFAQNLHAQNFDINLLRTINPHDPHAAFWQGTSKSYIFVSGAATLGSLAYGLIKSDKDVQYKAAETLLAIGIDVAVTTGLKGLINRTRPSDEYPNDVFVLNTSNGHSFPSGHTSLAFATATSFALSYRKWYVIAPAYLWAGCVGYSRMYLGKHFPSDVLGGAIVGAGSSLLSHWLSKKIFKQNKPAT